MNDKYHITSDGSIFEIQPDGSLKKLGTITDGAIKSYEESENKTSKTGTLTVLYDGKWDLVDTKQELYYNGKHVSDFYFKKPFRIDLPIDQSKITLKVKKWIFPFTFKFSLDPTKNYYARLAYRNIGDIFTLKVYDENNKIVYKSTLF